MQGFGSYLRRSVAVIALSLGMAVSAHAENLNDALRWAYENNPNLIASRAQVRQVQEGIEQAKAGKRPQVSFTGSYGVTNTEIDGGNRASVDQASMTLAASLLLWDGGATELAVDSARANLRAALLELRDGEQAILLQTVGAYLDVQRDRGLVGIAENNVRVLDKRVSSAQVGFDSGAMTRAQLSSTEAAAAGARAQLAVTRATLSVSESNYQALTGHKPGKLERVTVLPTLPNSEAAALQTADQSAPSILATIERERAALYDLRRATKRGQPTLSGSVTATRTNPLDGSAVSDVAAVGLELSVPLYTGGRNSSLERQAEAVLGAQSANVNAARASVAQRVYVAWAQLINADASIRANSQVVEAQTLADEGAEVEYELGVITIVDRLETEQELLAARSDALSARFQKQFAIYNMLAVMGRLDMEALGLGVKKINPLVVPTAEPQEKSPQAQAVENLGSRW